MEVLLLIGLIAPGVLLLVSYPVNGHRTGYKNTGMVSVPNWGRPWSGGN